MDRTLRQIVMLSKATVVALGAVPVFLLISMLFVRHDEVTLSAPVEPGSRVSQGSAMNAESKASNSKVGPVSIRVSASDLFRPELTLSLLNLKTAANSPTSLADATSPFAPSISAKAAQRAGSVGSSEPTAEVELSSATPSAHIAHKDLQIDENRSQTSPSDVAPPVSVETSSAEGAPPVEKYQLAWPDGWLVARNATNEKQNTTTKTDRGKAHSTHVRLAQKYKKPSSLTPKKDPSGGDDDQSNASPIFQPNIEDGTN
jgi:hypothetical protein